MLDVSVLGEEQLDEFLVAAGARQREGGVVVALRARVYLRLTVRLQQAVGRLVVRRRLIVLCVTKATNQLISIKCVCLGPYLLVSLFCKFFL